MCDVKDTMVTTTEGEINVFVQKALDEFVSSIKQKLDEETRKLNKNIAVKDVKKMIDECREEAGNIFYIFDETI